MSLEELTEKYIESAEQVLIKLKRAHPDVSEETVTTVLSWVQDYLKDAKYYKAQGKLETSLTSVAYCEGLLDALRLMGAVQFEWPTRQQKNRS